MADYLPSLFCDKSCKIFDSKVMKSFSRIRLE